MSKLDLLSRALKLTEKNTVKSKTSRVSTNDRLLKLLLNNEDGMTKLEIINQITMDRLEESMGRELEGDDFEDDEFIKQFGKLNKTVKNVFEASVCHGKNNASFSFNPKYDDYTLFQVNKRWYIELKD